MREYNTALASKARDGKSFTKLKTSSETDTVIVVESAKLVGLVGPAGLTAKLVELELEYITARDKAYSRLK